MNARICGNPIVQPATGATGMVETTYGYALSHMDGFEQESGVSLNEG